MILYVFCEVVNSSGVFIKTIKIHKFVEMIWPQDDDIIEDEVQHTVYQGSFYNTNPEGIQLGSYMYRIINAPPTFAEFSNILKPTRTFTFGDLRDMVLNYTMYNNKEFESLVIL